MTVLNIAFRLFVNDKEVHHVDSLHALPWFNILMLIHI